MKPEKWNTRRYVMFGALAGVAIMILRDWPGLSAAPELVWWHVGYITSGAIVGALLGAAFPVIRNRMDR